MCTKKYVLAFACIYAYSKNLVIFNFQLLSFPSRRKHGAKQSSIAVNVAAAVSAVAVAVAVAPKASQEDLKRPEKVL